VTWRPLLAVGAVLLAVAAAGCGGGDESTSEATGATPAAEWADGFCTAITTWTDELEGLKGQFTSLSSLSEEGLRTAADDLQASTEQLVSDIRGLGAPDTESGQEVKAALDEFASTVETQLADIETAVSGASGITGIASAAQDVLASLSAMTDAFSSALTTISDADAKQELEDALQASPACDEITR
jgi:methyl-accepting chemotaxis protein